MADSVADHDDDVVFMDEATAEQSLAAKLPSLEAITKAMEEAKNCVDMTDQEIQLIKEELHKSEDDLGKEIMDSLQSILENPAFQFSCGTLTESDLDKMITQILESIPPEEFDLSQEEFSALDHRLDLIEKVNHSISKIFLDCHTQLKEFRQKQSEETAAIEKELAGYSQKPLVINDIDEVSKSKSKIMQATHLVKERAKGQRSPGQSPASPGRGVPAPQSPQAQVPGSQPLQDLTWPNPQMPMPQQQRVPSINNLRPPHFTSSLSQSMPALVSSLQHQNQVTPLQTFGPQPPRPNIVHQPIHWPELKLQDKVLGKKFNDVWYSGTIMDINFAPSSQASDWCCRVKFDGKGMKWLPGKYVAYREPINCFIRVGTRVVALYREDDAPNTFYAGVIAEAPSSKNNRRFLVFFDDGYAQYCEAKELHKVYMQSSNVWEDINPETSAFIKEYLRIYPERPMVRLTKGQVVRTEWNGKWWTSKVVETDASLVKMYFQADKRTEWIYRGSTRLEPLFKALANADAIKAAGSAKGRRYNLNARPSGAPQKPSVEYTRGAADEDTSTNSSTSQSSVPKPPSIATTKGSSRTKSLPNSSVNAHGKKKSNNVARKSTTSSSFNSSNSSSSNPSAGVSSTWEAPWLKHQRRASATGIGATAGNASADASEKGAQKVKGSKDIASVLQERLGLNTNKVEYDGELATGERREVKIDAKARTPFKPHACSHECLQEISDDPSRMKGRNALQIPLLYGWERQVCKARPAAKRVVLYRTPCGRRLRNIEETDHYLFLTNSQLTIDLFSFDQHLHVNTEFVPVKTFCDIKDLSYGRENYPISCVNGVDRHYPDYVEYSDRRIPSKKVNLNTDPDFLVCCDCTDNCRDRSKCACQQLTIENTSWIGEKDPQAGYHYRRLKEPLFTGIVECNSKCKCDKRCANRVAQHGLSMRLQVFKTEKKGWGLRCLDDIAKGSFICIYAGQLLTDREANEDGKQYGDQYLAELDFIEVVERQKEGYESDVENMEFSDDEKDVNYKASKDSEEDRSLRRRKKEEEALSEVKESTERKQKESGEKTNPPTTLSEWDTITVSDDDEDNDNVEDKKEKTEEKMDTDKSGKMEALQHTLSHHMKHVEKLCRICGNKVQIGSSKRRVRCEKYLSSLLLYYNVDVSKDSADFSPFMCAKCYSRLCNIRARPEVTSLLETARKRVEEGKRVWMAYNKNIDVRQCTVCCQYRKFAKGGYCITKRKTRFTAIQKKKPRRLSSWKTGATNSQMDSVLSIPLPPSKLSKPSLSRIPSTMSKPSKPNLAGLQSTMTEPSKANAPSLQLIMTESSKTSVTILPSLTLEPPTASLTTLPSPILEPSIASLTTLPSPILETSTASLTSKANAPSLQLSMTESSKIIVTTLPSPALEPSTPILTMLPTTKPEPLTPSQTTLPISIPEQSIVSLTTLQSPKPDSSTLNLTTSPSPTPELSTPNLLTLPSPKPELATQSLTTLHSLTPSTSSQGTLQSRASVPSCLHKLPSRIGGPKIKNQLHLSEEPKSLDNYKVPSETQQADVSVSAEVQQKNHCCASFDPSSTLETVSFSQVLSSAYGTPSSTSTKPSDTLLYNNQIIQHVLRTYRNHHHHGFIKENIFFKASLSLTISKS
ncbi:histone-lysine N-methyltransferase [Plakobranchus ocellatus]|uniref:Histone-lysine N-methyltransferase n=1 Tax=Plakobranchus ocellatus TaxID=259542 RepID=A0AAV3ZH33_9GAST|nr:histone-lysine N-methyltransferase [Plakobranchus ocellatus]